MPITWAISDRKQGNANATLLPRQKFVRRQGNANAMETDFQISKFES